jgi:HK97 family phage prohead protease
MDRAALQAWIADMNEVAAALRARSEVKAVTFEAYDVFAPAEGKALVSPVAKQGEGGKLIVSGKVADFDWDREDEIFEPGAFDAGLEEFKKNPIMVFSHATKLYDTVKGPSGYVQIGKWYPESFEKRPDGLYATGEVYEPESGLLRDVYKQIERGDMRGASVGGKFHRHRSGDGRIRIGKVDLQEISIAPKPVNPRTLLTVSSAHV